MSDLSSSLFTVKEVLSYGYLFNKRLGQAEDLLSSLERQLKRKGGAISLRRLLKPLK